MNISGNTVLITGGGTGIGRALAEQLHAHDNQVIITGRRQAALDEVTAANRGMKSIVLDCDDAAAIHALAKRLTTEQPRLNVLVNNAGIMRVEKLLEQPDDLADAVAIVTTNLLGPIRLTQAFLPLLRRQPRSTIVTVSSGLAFVPLTLTPTYNATKAAIHSFTEALRVQVAGTAIQVIELIPPAVRTTLMGQQDSEQAMPLEEFLTETMALLRTRPDAKEILVENVKFLRSAATDGTYDSVLAMLSGH